MRNVNTLSKHLLLTIDITNGVSNIDKVCQSYVRLSLVQRMYKYTRT